ncbi:MAG TPA: Gfo/Idh/MocA family oxidoreductase [Vicinamibacterales bacterium]|nr:Gfo/Idh/MocA family oxidoreductase [Vicinamibacterales bacterium]
MFRWGLIGAGDIARRRVAPAMHDSPTSTLVAVSRARPERAAAFAAEFGAARWHADWRDLVADPGIDGVYVATTVDVHARQTIAAAEAGKHVLCEKPMAMTAADCDRMIAACRANGVTLAVAYYRRFYPVVERVKAIVGAGEIGAPVFAQMNALEWFDPGADHPRRWLLDPARAGGGPMMDFGCHRLEVLVNLFGAVRSAAGLTATVAFEREVEDTAAVLLRFDTGPCACVAVTHAVRDRQDTLDVFGTRGSIRCGNLNAGDLRIVVDDAERVESHPPAANVHLPLIEDFVGAVRENRPPAVSGEVGRQVAAIEDQIYGVTATVR